MTGRRRRPAPTRKRPLDWSETLAGYAGSILKLSALVLLVATGYLLWGILGGYLNQPADGRVVANIRLVGQVLAISGGVCALCLVVISFAEVAWSALGAVVGFAFLLGTPFLIANNLRNPSSEVATQITIWGTWTGKIIIVIVGLRLLYEVYIQLVRGTAVRRRAESEEAESPGAKKKSVAQTMWPWTPCWEMPYCHEAIKEMCPAFKAHKTCWRYGTGCNCDPGLIESLIRTGGGGSGARQAQTRQIQEAYIRSDLEADVVRPGQKRTIPCSKCAIYNEHQRAKYRVINPLAIGATILALIIFYRPLMALYQAFIGACSQLASRFTFSDEIDPSVWFNYLDSGTIRAFFVIILGLLLLSYVLRFVEWAILVKKI